MLFGSEALCPVESSDWSKSGRIAGGLPCAELRGELPLMGGSAFPAKAASVSTEENGASCADSSSYFCKTCSGHR